MAKHASKSFIQEAAHHPAARQSAPVRGPSADSRAPSIGAEERLRMIREVAYSFYERRGFVQGRDLEDWLEAEAHVDRMLFRRQTPESIEAMEPDLQQSTGRSIIRDEKLKRILKQHPQRDVPKF
ncbi:MAG: DUF2934 domain-containing protein [Betaproteobacteria bacterium]|nr:DUF2934 domain-containing protein [Betaproteobacteria bacterium]